jgi:dipeptidyl aminopeptidase/acylaminoacyl peptidase
VDTSLRVTDLARTGPYQLTSYRTKRGVAVRRPGETVFRRLPWPEAAVSRAGRVAVLDTTDGTPGTRLGIVDGDRVRWFPLGVPALHPDWSPDGRRVLVTMVSVDSALGQRDGFALVDPDTGSVDRVAGLIGATAPALAGSGLDWDPDGASVRGVVDATTYGDDPPRFALGRWDLDGATLPAVPLPGPPGTAATQVVSPWDGSVAASTGAGVTVVRGTDGRVLARPSTTATAVYGWRDRTHLVVADGGGLTLLGLDGATAPYALGYLPGRAALTRVG